MAIVRHSDNWGIFRFSDTSTTAGIRRRCYRDDNLKLHSDGSNLAAFVQTSEITPYCVSPNHRDDSADRPLVGDFVLEPLKPNETDLL